VNTGLFGAAYRGLRDPSSTVDLQLARLYRKIAAALAASGDTDEVCTGFERLSRTGTGATRQRALSEDSVGPHDFVAALAEATIPVAPATYVPPPDWLDAAAQLSPAERAAR
jgi:hypothetical protein